MVFKIILVVNYILIREVQINKEILSCNEN